MDTFGERLTWEREDRGLSIQAVAEILGVDDDRLRALERNDFDALPDEATMMECLRAYAECLEVDADLMIEDYLREREKSLRRLADAVADDAVAGVPAAIPSGADRRPWSPRLLGAFATVAIVVILGAWWMFSKDGSPSRPETPVATPSVDAQPTSTPSRVEIPRTASELPARRTPPTTSRPSALSIPDCDVGTAVENRQLVGRSDRFIEGTQVWFWTLVQDGKAGDSIDHVWLREGVEAARISLSIGGSRWRTHSATTLRAGSAGNWAVEARDATGRLLARREFVCVL